MRDILKMTLVLLACMVFVVGCGDKEDENGDGTPSGKGGGLLGAAGASTPKGAVVAMARAMEAGDADAFADCFDATADEKGVLKKMGGAMGKLVAFNKAGEKAYGKAEWNEAGGGKGGPSMPSADDIAAKAEIKEEGDKATCMMEGENKPLNLVKKDGKWLIDPEELLPPASERDKMLKMMGTMAGAVDGPMKKIGQPGVTAKQVHEEFGKAMMAAMMKSMGEMKAPPDMPKPPDAPGMP